MGHVKLFIPGPIEVSAKTLAAFAKPVIGHRSQAFKDLYAKIQPRLQQLFYTKQPVFISTSSAWGVMEGSIRNLVNKRSCAAATVLSPTSGWTFLCAAAKRRKL